MHTLPCVDAHSVTIKSLLQLAKKGKKESATIEMISALEGYMQEEALQAQSTVPSAAHVLAPTAGTRITYVVSERPTTIFDDAASDLSDTMFDEVPAKPAPPGAQARKRVQEVRVDSTGKQMLREEFQELAETQMRAQIEAGLEAELDDDFFSGAMVDDADSLVGDILK